MLVSLNMNTVLDDSKGYWSMQLSSYHRDLLRPFLLESPNFSDPDTLHVTLGYDISNSYNPVSLLKADTRLVGFPNGLDTLDGGAVVVKLISKDLHAEHRRIHKYGHIRYPYPEYLPHVTLGYNVTDNEMDKLLWLYNTKISGYLLSFTNQSREICED